jgi:hypothetical protein
VDSRRYLCGRISPQPIPLTPLDPQKPPWQSDCGAAPLPRRENHSFLEIVVVFHQKKNNKMASSADDCVPQTLTDFVFDLYDSVTLAQLPEEQSRLYNVVLRDLSSKVSHPYLMEC